VTSATKSNGISITMPYWDERFKAISAEYPGVKTSQYHIDILTAHFVQHPDWFDVVVGSNLFGDILSDLGPACTGTIGIAPSANMNPGARIPVVLRAGAWKRAGHLRQGDRESHRTDLVGGDDDGPPRPSRCRRRDREGDRDRAEEGPRTRDMGGTANTADVGKAIAGAL
jgi:tartrate dehydrogenase/decarboxylase/D-malate dehydrogenase